MSDTVDAGPFDWVPSDHDGRRTALLLHGFTGTPYEMRPIGEELVKRGFRCVGPVMAGHHQTHVELGRVHWREWVDEAADHLEQLRDEAEHVVVAGMSMGGLVTLALAASHTPAAIAVMGAPLQLPRSIRWRIPIGKYFKPYFPKSDGPGGPDIREHGARERHPGVDAIPLAGMHEILKLQKHVRGVLERIVCPTIVAHGAYDETASPRDAYRTLGEINAGRRELFIGERSGHVISVDYDSAECAKRIGVFFEASIADRER